MAVKQKKGLNAELLNDKVQLQKQEQEILFSVLSKLAPPTNDLKEVLSTGRFNER